MISPFQPLPAPLGGDDPSGVAPVPLVYFPPLATEGPRDHFVADQPESSEPEDRAQLPPRTLADIMTSPVLTARAEQPLREVVEMLGRHRIAGVPVLSEEGELVGVISQSDVAAHVACAWAEVPPAADPSRFFQSLWISDPDLHERMTADTPVGEVMAAYVHFATPDTPLDEAADLMLAHGIHRIVVLQGSELIGIVSSLDLLRAYRCQG